MMSAVEFSRCNLFLNHFSPQLVVSFHAQETVGALWNIGGLWDPGWGMLSPEEAFVFVDNHDNQRGHGSGSGVVTFGDPV